MMPFERFRSLIRVSVWLLGAVLAAILLIVIGVQTLAQSGEGSSSHSSQGADASSLIPSQSRLPAPELNLTDIAGRNVNLAGYRGKVVLLDFWAVDCGGCVIEIPWYVEFDKKYHDKGLQLIGIDMYEESP